MPRNRRQRSLRRQHAMGRDIHKNKKPHMPLTWTRSNKIIPPKESPHRYVKINNWCIHRTTQRHIQRSEEQNIRQIPLLQLQARGKRTTGKIPQQNQTKSSTMQLGGPRG